MATVVAVGMAAGIWGGWSWLGLKLGPTGLEPGSGWGWGPGGVGAMVGLGTGIGQRPRSAT